MKKDYDFIVGFTLFNPSGFKTRFRHFDNLRVAEMFCENRNLKNNSKIYVDYDYFKDKIKAKIEEYKEKCKNCNFKGKICEDLTKNYNCTIAVCLNEFYSLLNKEMGDK